MPERTTHELSRWTMPVLRVGMGLFLAYWGADKLVDTEGGASIFEGFYGIEGGLGLVQVAGIAQIVVAVMLATGLLRVLSIWITFAQNTVSTLASWRMILDPWAIWGLREGGNAHLFLASIVIMAAHIVLVLNARDDFFTLDRKLGLWPASGGSGAGGGDDAAAAAGGADAMSAGADRGSGQGPGSQVEEAS